MHSVNQGRMPLENILLVASAHPYEKHHILPICLSFRLAIDTTLSVSTFANSFSDTLRTNCSVIAYNCRQQYIFVRSDECAS